MKKNVTLALDESLLKKARSHADSKKLSFNSFITKLLQETVEDSPKSQMQRVLKNLRQFQGDSKGRKWTRGDLYERD